MNRVRALLLALLLVPVVFAGCADRDGPDDDVGPPITPPDALDLWQIYLDNMDADDSMPPPRIPDPGVNGTAVVVAVIDSGVDPFHSAFARPETLAEGTLPVHAIDQETGDAPVFVPVPLIAGYRGSEWLHAILAPKTLYRFAGTNLLYYSVNGEISALDTEGHGTGTAGLVAATSPDAILVMVQSDDPGPALQWAAAQPWIDVISVSWGCQANCAAFYPFAATVDPLDQKEVVEATRAATAAGKPVVFSAGNDPTPQMTDHHDGPPWTISVGGADPYRRGEAYLASKAPDILANYTGLLPARGSVDAYGYASGTSFAAPIVAGVLAESVLRLRATTGHVGGISGGALVEAGGQTFTALDLREALNLSAVYWATTDYSPTAPHPADPTKDPTNALDAGVPINPAAPWLQMGWGYVDGATADTITEGLLSGSLPGKPAEAKAYRDSVQAIRAALWP